MISIEEIKQMIIKQETEWLQEIHGDDENQMYIDGMKDDVNECSTIDDLVNFYTNSGFSVEDGLGSIIELLRKNTQIKE